MCSLKGRPDYSIRYGDEEESSVNCIAIEAKSDSRISPGIPHALGYMGKCPFNFPTTICWGETNLSGGAVHRLRKEQKKMDCTCFIPNLIVGKLGFLGVC